MASDLPIPAPLASALADKGYDTLTTVQEAVLAEETLGRDLLVSAQTGSGKTAAFGMAMAPRVLGEDTYLGRADIPLALVIAPTRELAQQVERELAWLYAIAGARLATCVGGMDPRRERVSLERGAHIVVGTPGRLRDHIERGALDLSQIRVAVLDEADEMLDFGFREDLEFILDAAPSERQTLLFSATVPPSIQDIARRYQRDSLRISAGGEKAQHADIDYQALSVAPSDRENAIVNVLRYHDAERAIVFCSTREAVNRLASRFANRGFHAVALSGELTQKERMHALQALRDGRARVCIATDVAARGIDLPGLELVVHADLPGKADTLLHRSGRTGRAGRKGICTLIVPHTRRGKAMRLFREAKLNVEWSEAPGLDKIRARDRERLLDSDALTAEVDESKLEDARALIEKFGAERIAAAFLAQAEAALPAAEELLDAGPGKKPREPRSREDFGEGVWFRINVGRKQRAEPRWLLPLICRVGHVTRREIGAIRIDDTESRFQISADDAERFLRGVQASGGGEKSIRILPDDGTPLPDAGEEETPKPRRRRERPDRSEGGERSDRPHKPREEGDRRKKAYRPDRPSRDQATPDGESRPERTSSPLDSGKPPRSKAKPPRERVERADRPAPADRPARTDRGGDRDEVFTGKKFKHKGKPKGPKKPFGKGKGNFGAKGTGKKPGGTKPGPKSGPAAGKGAALKKRPRKPGQGG